MVTSYILEMDYIEETLKESEEFQLMNITDEFPTTKWKNDDHCCLFYYLIAFFMFISYSIYLLIFKERDLLKN